MNRIRDVDGDQHTVIMTQVENEVGMVPDARDYGTAANAAVESITVRENQR